MTDELRKELAEYHKRQIEFHETLIASHEEALNHDRVQLDLHRRFVEGLEQREMQLELGKKEE